MSIHRMNRSRVRPGYPRRSALQIMAMTDRVKCIECDRMILPQTAADNDGLCGRCVQKSPEHREFERQVADGSAFMPSDKERASSRFPHEFFSARWELQPDYYAERNVHSAIAAIAAAKSESVGNVFLVTGTEGHLNLGFTERYAVCEYANQESGEFRCAYSESNLRCQVPKELHVAKACPCCGVVMTWYPSRFHMPRDKAFLVLENLVANRHTPGVDWLETDDFSYWFTDRGRG